MRIIQETRLKLNNIILTYTKEDAEKALGEAKPVIDNLFNALGGCDYCYGKGFNLEDYDYCSHCDRGKQLKKFVENKDA